MRAAFQQRSTLPFPSPLVFCGSRDQADLLRGGHVRRCHGACVETPRPTSQQGTNWVGSFSVALVAVTTEHRGESLLHRMVTRRLCERLVVSSGISNHQKSRFSESCLDLVTEGSGREAAISRSSPRGSGKLQHSSLTSIPERHGRDISWVFSGNHGTSWQQKFLQVLLRFIL